MEILLKQVVIILYVMLFILVGFSVYLFTLLRPRRKQADKKVIKRAVQKNYGKFADPIGESYEQFKDVKTKLYTTYEPKKKMRRGEDVE